MTAIAGLRQRSADLLSRWSSTGCDDTRPHAPCHHPGKLATTAFTVRRHHQSELPLATCRSIARAQAHYATSRAPSESAKSP
jgi:hypothetical protein